MKSTAIWTKDFQSVVDNGRSHSAIIDLPEEKGGGNSGPTALEMCVMSLCGCISTIFARVATKMKIEFENYKVEVYAEQEQGAPTITDAHCVLYVHTQCPEERVERCFETTIKNCPVGTLFSQAGVLITHEVIVTN
ncbi:OsmC family protein [Bacteroidales bacterium OttesenSCG-928-B11]|nr:OsmC family protein [Bacteroidales bacterium OttesenSCG-928-E04]MDL2312900.1 OsmC family protein [Bacteroidales bacterium OttesenSCG-928-B11]MDL2326384.1 OsmC family protein [Bacteroidales bacterium OttesenSCG-928-A14]